MLIVKQLLYGVLVYVRFPASSSVFTFVYLSWLSCGAGIFEASSTIRYKYLRFQSHINENQSGSKTKNHRIVYCILYLVKPNGNIFNEFLPGAT